MSLLEGLWTHVGPGLLLVPVLPLALLILAALAWEARGRRVGRSTDAD